MRPPMRSSRAVVTRTTRHDPRGAALESVAAEFALLAQRRARVARQLDLLGRQLQAAQATLDCVQGRMALLAQRMDGIDPSLRPAPALLAPPAPAYSPASYSPPGRGQPDTPAPQGSRYQPRASAYPAQAPRRDAAAPRTEPATARPPAAAPRMLRPVLRRRPFQPE